MVAAIFIPPDKGGVVPGPSVCNGYVPEHRVTGNGGPWYVSADCTTVLTDCVMNSLTSEILAAVDHLGYPYNSSRVDNLGEALADTVRLLREDIARRILRSGDRMEGPLELVCPPEEPAHAACKLYVDEEAERAARACCESMESRFAELEAEIGAASTRFVRRDGDAMTGPLILHGDPTVELGAVTKQYADSLLGSILIAPAPPSGIPHGRLWWNSSNGSTYIRYDDGTSIQWVEACSACGDGMEQVLVEPPILGDGTVDAPLTVDIATETDINIGLETAKLITPAGLRTQLGAPAGSLVTTAKTVVPAINELHGLIGEVVTEVHVDGTSITGDGTSGDPLKVIGAPHLPHLPLTGGTLAGPGNLTVSGALNVLKASPTSTNTAQIWGRVGGNARWRIELGDDTGEPVLDTWSNPIPDSGSGFRLTRYHDDGTVLDSPLWIGRENGVVQTNNILAYYDVTSYGTMHITQQYAGMWGYMTRIHPGYVYSQVTGGGGIAAELADFCGFFGQPTEPDLHGYALMMFRLVGGWNDVTILQKQWYMGLRDDDTWAVSLSAAVSPSMDCLVIDRSRKVTIAGDLELSPTALASLRAQLGLAP